MERRVWEGVREGMGGCKRRCGRKSVGGNRRIRREG